MDTSRHYIVSRFPPAPEHSQGHWLAVDYDMFDLCRAKHLYSDCLAFYHDKPLHAQWLEEIERYAQNLDQLLGVPQKNESVGLICGNILWSVLSKFIGQLVAFQTFLEKNVGSSYTLAEDLHPILRALYQDLVESYQGTTVSRDLPDFSSVIIPPPHMALNKSVAKTLNCFGRFVKPGGILFHRYCPPRPYFDLSISRGQSFSLVNPPQALVKDLGLLKNIGFFFTYLQKQAWAGAFVPMPFIVRRATMTNVLSALSQKILSEYWVGYQELNQDMVKWLDIIRPSLAVLGETESAIARIIYVACHAKGVPVMHVPHGLFGSWSGFRVIEGADNSDLVLAHTCALADIESKHKQALLASTSFFPVLPPKGVLRMPTEKVLILEYNISDILPGESDLWYYHSTLELIRAHLKTFPEKKVLFRPRPYFFKEGSKRGWIDFVKRRFIYGAPLEFLAGGVYLERQRRLIEYLNRHLPSGSFSLDVSATFGEAASQVDAVIGGFSTCFLEAMRMQVPYYCYNPGNLDCPPPLDAAKPYVFNTIDNLLAAIYKTPFEVFYEEYAADMEVEKMYLDYEKAKTVYSHNRRHHLVSVLRSANT